MFYCRPLGLKFVRLAQTSFHTTIPISILNKSFCRKIHQSDGNRRWKLISIRAGLIKHLHFWSESSICDHLVRNLSDFPNDFSVTWPKKKYHNLEVFFTHQSYYVISRLASLRCANCAFMLTKISLFKCIISLQVYHLLMMFMIATKLGGIRSILRGESFFYDANLLWSS